VDASALSDIVAAADLPAGEIRLIVGDPLLSEDFQGITIERQFVRFAGNIYGLEEFLEDEWECGVLIGPEWAQRQPEFPAYFAYLLGHELGHATTVLTNLEITIYEDLLLHYIGRASGSDTWRWGELPHEIRYDQFGIAVSEAVYGRSTVEENFGRILAQGLSKDEPRLRKVLSLPARLDLKGLRNDIAEFARPFKEELMALWQEDRDRGGLGIANGLRKFDALWTRSN